MLLVEIRKNEGKLPYKLYLMKKNGLKFKKSFLKLEFINPFLEQYFLYSCAACLKKGWVYKTKSLPDCRGGIRGPSKQDAPEGSIVECSECKTKHVVSYEDQQIMSWSQIQHVWRGEIFKTKKREIHILKIGE